MNRFRYDTSGHWYKGNVHIHTTASDGGKTCAEVAELYASAGYDFLFLTDHMVPSDMSHDKKTYPLVLLDGVEIHGQDHTGAAFHVVCLGRIEGIGRDDGFVPCLQAAREQGALLLLAHPRWSGNTVPDCLRWQFDGVEAYNHVCHWLNGKSDGFTYWDMMLKERPDTLAFAVDDAHIRPEHPGWNGGWITVNAKDRSAQDIMAAIRRGNFYSSCGPEIHSMTIDGNRLHLRTSPVQFVRLAGPGSLGTRTGSFDGHLITETAVDIPESWEYAYLEIEDQQHRRAWTNTLFVAGKPSGNT